MTDKLITKSLVMVTKVVANDDANGRCIYEGDWTFGVLCSPIITGERIMMRAVCSNRSLNEEKGFISSMVNKIEKIPGIGFAVHTRNSIYVVEELDVGLNNPFYLSLLKNHPGEGPHPKLEAFKSALVGVNINDLFNQPFHVRD